MESIEIKKITNKSVKTLTIQLKIYLVNALSLNDFTQVDADPVKKCNKNIVYNSTHRAPVNSFL